MTEEVIIGIDLGTTYSACAVWQDGAEKVIPNSVGSAIAPSVVGLDDDGTVLVGQAAKERLHSHPDLWEAKSCRTTKRRGSETLSLRDPASSQARNLEVSPFMRLRTGRPIVRVAVADQPLLSSSPIAAARIQRATTRQSTAQKMNGIPSRWVTRSSA